MQNRTLKLAASLASLVLVGPACKDISCGDGTIEKSGACVPSDDTVGTAACGPFTVLQGDKCVPMFDPTQCDTATTTPVTDPATGVTTCVGNGSGGGCSGVFACAPPMDGTHATICGQIYDLATDQPFQAASPTGTRCTAATATGPCALSINAVDAAAFAMNPTGTTPLSVGNVYIDDCGRYRMENIASPSGPFIGLGFDDASSSLQGPAGITNAIGTAMVAQLGLAVPNFDGFVGSKTMSDAWTASGGPAASAGMYINIFRAHQVGHDEQAGVTFCKQQGSTCVPVPNDDYYFRMSETGRMEIDPAATATGANGTAIVTNIKLSDGGINTGMGAIDSKCLWQTHPGSSIPNVLFVQVKRPQDNFMGDTCDL